MMNKVLICGKISCGNSWYSVSRGKVFDTNGIAPCIVCSGKSGGANVPKILIYDK